MNDYIQLGPNCSKIGSGATPRGGKDSYLDYGPYTLVRSQNIYNDGFKFDGLAYISQEQADKLSNVVLLENDILLNITGDSVARACQVHREALPGRVNQHVAIIRPNLGKIDSSFLRYWLVHPTTQDFLLGLSSAGATRKALTKSMIETLELPNIEIETQRLIGSTLKLIDDKIELNQQMNETLEAMAQTIFKDWFVDFGPVKRKASGASDPIKILGGLISNPDKAARIINLFSANFGDDGLPEGWDLGRLSDIAEEQKDKAKPDNVNSNTPYIGLEHMPRNSIALDSWDTAAKVSSAKSRFEKNQILFGKLRPYFHKVGIAAISGICSTDIVVVDALKPFDRALVCSICSSKEFVEYNTQASSGTRMPRTKWKVMGDYPIAIGDVPVRSAYSDIVSPMHNKIQQSILENQSLAEARDYLLPRLMSGEVRVTDLDEVA